MHFCAGPMRKTSRKLIIGRRRKRCWIKFSDRAYTTPESGLRELTEQVSTKLGYFIIIFKNFPPSLRAPISPTHPPTSPNSERSCYEFRGWNNVKAREVWGVYVLWGGGGGCWYVCIFLPVPTGFVEKRIFGNKTLGSRNFARVLLIRSFYILKKIYFYHYLSPLPPLHPTPTTTMSTFFFSFVSCFYPLEIFIYSCKRKTILLWRKKFKKWL